MKYYIYFCFIGIIFLFGCCSYCSQLKKDLEDIKNESQERNAFKTISSYKDLSFGVYDKSGKQIRFVTKNWWKNAKKIYFYYKGEKIIEYKVINPDNINLLMRE